MKSDDRPYNFIIYGATGFTGKYCMEYMKLCLEKKETVYRWAIAGRNEQKLIEARDFVADILGTNLDHIPVIIADNEDEQSLIRMCKQCNVLINCVGPFSKFGEPVVDACIQAKTHQVDLCAETLHNDRTRLKYHKKAEHAGVLIVNSCAFGYLMWEAGVNHMKDVNKPIIFNSIESTMDGFFSSGFNDGTFESLLESMSNLMQLIRNRIAVCKQAFTKPLPIFDYTLPSKYLPFYSEEDKGWCINANAIQSTVIEAQHYNYIYRKERPTQFNGYFVIPSLLWLIMCLFLNVFIFFFTRCNCGTRLLRRYLKPLLFGLFPSDGPKREHLLRSPFKIRFIGKGWKNENEMNQSPNIETQLVVKGPDFAYLSTSICIIAAAIAIQEEFNTESIPFRGGVFTPGVAFRHTRIVETLKKNSITFTLID